MSNNSPLLLERIVRALRTGSPRSSGDLAREFLNLGIIDEQLAARLLDPLLAADARLERAVTGWTLAESSRYSATATEAGQTAPLWPALAVLAPVNLPIAVELNAGDAPAACSVTLTGEAELIRAEALLGRPLPRPVIALATVVRRWRGYRGVPDSVAIAEALHLPHLESEGPEGAVQLVATIWRALTAQLALEAVHDHAALEQLLQDRLELPDFDGRAFGPDDLAALPRTPGIYIFRDRSDSVLYVGQSINLAMRVASYFQGPPRDDKDREIRAAAHALETREQQTAVDALLAETKAIRRLKPRLNSRRAIHRAPVEDGVLLAYREDGGSGAAAFVVSGGTLIARIAIPAGGRRGALAAERAARTLFAGGTRVPGGGEGAALIATLRRQRPELPFLRPAVDGGVGEVAAALESFARSFSSAV
ncbi:MAG: nucleotide excision repair endonuclease [Acidobacteriota bacterium]